VRVFMLTGGLMDQLIHVGTVCQMQLQSYPLITYQYERVRWTHRQSLTLLRVLCRQKLVKLNSTND